MIERVVNPDRSDQTANSTNAALVEALLGVQNLVSAGAPPKVTYEAILDGAVIEVTGSERLQDSPGAIASLHALKEIGVRTALDDFGTGYSTLLNLSQLPIDVLTVAKPFVDAVGGDGRNPSGLLAGIISLGKHLGFRTVAEGIEREDQRELLTRLGCDLGQGYLLGRPLDSDAATELLAAERNDDRHAA